MNQKVFVIRRQEEYTTTGEGVYIIYAESEDQATEYLDNEAYFDYKFETSDDFPPERTYDDPHLEISEETRRYRVQVLIEPDIFYYFFVDLISKVADILQEKFPMVAAGDVLISEDIQIGDEIQTVTKKYTDMLLEEEDSEN